MPSAQDTVVNWLDSIGIVRQNHSASQEETTIKNSIVDKVLDGVIYDMALAQEIKSKFPLTVSI